MKAETFHPMPQDHSKATYAPSLKKEDGRIDWKREALEIDRQVRAFNPWPGAFTRWKGRLMKVNRGEIACIDSVGIKVDLFQGSGFDFKDPTPS